MYRGISMISIMSTNPGINQPLTKLHQYFFNHLVVQKHKIYQFFCIFLITRTMSWHSKYLKIQGNSNRFCNTIVPV